MACGVPVLTSNVSSLPEVGGTAALLVNPHDTEEIAAGLIRLISEAELRQELVSKGYQQIQKFTWQTAARQILQILEQICQPSPPP
jgi:glycosyltransferase involved in cell wall biosynthesis